MSASSQLTAKLERHSKSFNDKCAQLNHQRQILGKVRQWLSAASLDINVTDGRTPEEKHMIEQHMDRWLAKLGSANAGLHKGTVQLSYRIGKVRTRREAHRPIRRPQFLDFEVEHMRESSPELQVQVKRLVDENRRLLAGWERDWKLNERLQEFLRICVQSLRAVVNAKDIDKVRDVMRNQQTLACCHVELLEIFGEHECDYRAITDCNRLLCEDCALFRPSQPMSLRPCKYCAQPCGTLSFPGPNNFEWVSEWNELKRIAKLWQAI